MAANGPRKCYCLRWAASLRQWEPLEAADWRRAIQAIQPEEWTRIEKFVFREDGLSSLAGRLLLRRATQTLTGASWSEIKFARTEKWKPYLVSPTDVPEYGINLSHQGDFIILGTSCTKQIGVDVMNIERPSMRSYKTADEYINFMEKSYSEAELSSMRWQNSDKLKLTYFYRYWCLKESVIKATGVGLHDDLAGLDFRVRTHGLSPEAIFSDTVLMEKAVRQSQWVFEEGMLDKNHCFATCREAKLPPNCELEEEKMRFARVTIKELLADAEVLNPLPNDALDQWEKFSQKPAKPSQGAKIA